MKEVKKRPEICLILNCRTLEDIKAEIDHYGEGCQLVEWCADKNSGFDNFTDAEFIGLLKLVKSMCMKKTFIFSYQGDEKETVRFLRLAMGIADYIDVDWKCEQMKNLIREAHRRKTKVLLTYHELDRIMTKDDISTELIKMEGSKADMLAIISFANTEADAYAVLEGAFAYNQLKRHTPFLALAMGEEGQASRICGGDFGSVMTYACGSHATAPGQFNSIDLKRYMDKYYK